MLGVIPQTIERFDDIHVAPQARRLSSLMSKSSLINCQPGQSHCLFQYRLHLRPYRERSILNFILPVRHRIFWSLHHGLDILVVKFGLIHQKQCSQPQLAVCVRQLLLRHRVGLQAKPLQAMS